PADLDALIDGRAFAGLAARRMHAVDTVEVGAADDGVGRTNRGCASAFLRDVAFGGNRRTADRRARCEDVGRARRRSSAAFLRAVTRAGTSATRAPCGFQLAFLVAARAAVALFAGLDDAVAAAAARTLRRADGRRPRAVEARLNCTVALAAVTRRRVVVVALL